MIYSIFEELFNYFCIIKLLRYKKNVTIIFTEIKQLTQYLLFVITKHQTIWNSIILIIALNFLYNNFEITTTSLLYSDNKDLKEIQQIVTSTKVANIAKQATGQTKNLVIITKKKTDNYQ